MITEIKNESKKDLRTELISKLQGNNNAKTRFNRLVENEEGTTGFSELKGPLSELDHLLY